MARNEDLSIRVKAEDDASKVLDRIGAEVKDLDGTTADVNVKASGLDDITGKLGELPGLFGQVGGAVGSAGLAGAATAIGAGLFAAAQSAADMAVDAKTTAQLTGDTVADASRLQAVWKGTGADVNDLNDVLLQMNGALADAPDLAKKIGVNLNDGRSIGERFVEVVGKVDSGLIDATTQSKLFGEEGVRQVARMSTLVEGDLQSALDGVADTQIMSDADVDRAVAFKKQMQETTVALQGVATAIGQDILPVLTQAAGLIEKGTGKRDNFFVGVVEDAINPLGRLGGKLEELRRIFGDTTDAEAASGWGVHARGLGRVGSATEDAADAADHGATAFDALGGAVAGAFRDARNAESALAGLAGAIDGVAKSSQELADGRRAQADSAFAVRDAERDLEQAMVDTLKQIKEAPGMTADNAQALDDLARSAGNAADAAVQYASDQGDAMGVTLSATDAQSIWNRSMVDSARTAQGPMRQAIVDYIATVNGIPPEVVSEILADPDYESIEEAAAAIDRAAQDRVATIWVKVAGAAAAGAALGALAGATRTATVTVPTAAGYSTGPAAAGPTTMAVPAAAVYTPSRAPSITVNAGVVGNRFDVERTVAHALRRYERRNGRRRP